MRELIKIAVTIRTSLSNTSLQCIHNLFFVVHKSNFFINTYVIYNVDACICEYHTTFKQKCHENVSTNVKALSSFLRSLINI